ncbi:MAG: hypothetical protein FJ026_00820 [Chloroflexi bacterium]|nr:hypothetical protein [Chloroflexota bacterium]
MSNPTGKQNAQPTRYYYAGAGLAIGAGVGSVVGLLLLQNLAIAAGAGAALGLLFGAAIDAQRHKGTGGAG